MYTHRGSGNERRWHEHRSGHLFALPPTQRPITGEGVLEFSSYATLVVEHSSLVLEWFPLYPFSTPYPRGILLLCGIDNPYSIVISGVVVLFFNFLEIPTVHAYSERGNENLKQGANHFTVDKQNSCSCRWNLQFESISKKKKKKKGRNVYRINA